MPKKEKSGNLFISKGLGDRDRHDESNRIFVIRENSRIRWRNFTEAQVSSLGPCREVMSSKELPKPMTRATEAAHPTDWRVEEAARRF